MLRFDAHPVFALYRSRTPVAILGLMIRRGWTWGPWEHPDVKAAQIEWSNALSLVMQRQTDCREYVQDLAQQERRRQRGVQNPEPPYRPPSLDEELSPLMLAARDVGLTEAEWDAALEHRIYPNSPNYRGWREGSRMHDSVRYSPIHLLAEILAEPR